MLRRHLPVVCGALAALSMLLCVGLVDMREAFEARDKRIHDWLDTRAGELENAINSRLHLVWGLGAFVQANPDFTEDEFLRFAGALETRWGGIRSLQLAPNGVVTYLTQPEQNAKARGHDLLADGDRRPAVVRAIENREYIIAGPFSLIQGGEAIVGRMPVYVTGPTASAERFWGFATILLNVEKLFESAGLVDEALEYEIALRGRDGLGEGGAVFFGDAVLFEDAALQTKVALPHGSWILAARAKSLFPGYWHGRYQLWMIGIALSLAAGLLAFGLLQWPLRLRQAVLQATKALKASRQQYRQLAQIAPVGIYHADAAGNVMFANEQFRKITDIWSDEISFGDWNDRLHPDDAEYANAEWDEAVTSGVSHCEYRYFQCDGTVVWVLDQAMKVEEDEAGNAKAFIGTLTDITAQMNAQLELENARETADSANQAKSDFLASISHEIRTPLNGILGMVRVMLRTAPNDEAKSRLTILEHSADTLLELLNEVLDYSQIESGQLEVTQGPIHLHRLVHDLAALWQTQIEEKGLRLVLDLVGCPADVRLGDEKRIRQVLSNLISNAAKFTERGTIKVAARQLGGPSDKFLFSVTDSGIGISPADQRVIFDKFTQADGSASRRYEGTGLGLAISRELAELMGGSISVASAVGEGSTFELVLPCPASNAVIEPAVPLSSSNPAQGSGAVLRILVAEDNLINQQVISAMLDNPLYSVDMVSNGKQAVEQVSRETYDIVLMDIRMPELDGTVAAQQIRAMQGPVADIPIIALTANAAAGDRNTYLAHGMNDCVTKPIKLEELVDTIHRHTELVSSLATG